MSWKKWTSVAAACLLAGSAIAQSPVEAPSAEAIPTDDAATASPPSPWAAAGVPAPILPSNLPAHCAASIEEPSRFEKALDKLDGAFGKVVVGPVAWFLFYDLKFWDNTLPPNERAVGALLTEDGQPMEVVSATLIKSKDKRTAGKSIARYKVRTRKSVSDWELPGQIQAGDTVLHAGAEHEVLQSTSMLVLRSEKTQETTLAAKGRKPAKDPHCYPIGLLDGSNEVTAANDALYTTARRLQIPAADVEGDPASGKVWAQGLDLEVLHSYERFTLASKDLSVLTGTRPNPNDIQVPFIVLWLVLGAIFFTIRMGLINLRGFKHAILVTTGKYDDPNDPGEVSHFAALSSALSATVGLGNIAGVALAVQVGGPGAIFWMVVAGFLGMSSKFVECTLGQMYRQIDDNGVVSGGPMRYLHTGLEERGMGGLGRKLAILFAVMCIGGSLGGGNMFQANQAYAQMSQIIEGFPSWLFGIMLAVCVAMVIIGGIKRIGKAAGMIVPIMCGVYVLAGLGILLSNITRVDDAFMIIMTEAFSPRAAIVGGFVGVLVQGFRRAAFSNEAGVGSASIAHSAATTSEPVREGIVALLEPFIDTIVVCTMTGLVVVITGVYAQDVGDGVLMTSAAFETVYPWFPLVLAFAVLMFAFSTMISWSYYGERCWSYLFGGSPTSAMIYRSIFVLFVFFGSVFKLGNVLDFSDLAVLGMAFPNIFGAVLLTTKVREKLDDYWGRYKAGEMDA